MSERQGGGGRGGWGWGGGRGAMVQLGTGDAGDVLRGCAFERVCRGRRRGRGGV